MLWLARAAGLGLYIALVTRAMHHMPDRAWLVATLALMPVSLFQAATVSADGITLALCLLASAYALRMVTVDATAALPRGLVAEGFAIAVAIGLAKPPYVLLLLLLVPAVLRPRAPGRRLLWCSVGAAGLAVAALWNHYAQGVYVAPEGVANIDSGRQLRFVASHPVAFVKAIASTAAKSGLRIGHEMLLATPAWKPSNIFVGVTAVALVAAIVAAVGRPSARNAAGQATVVSATAIGALIGLAVLLLAYAGWNTVGASRIDDLQGRYLFPCIALFVLAVGREAGGRAFRVVVSFGAVALLGAVTLAGLAVHYYT